MSNWKDISENNSKFVMFNKKIINNKLSMTLLLEERNKSWNTTYNWRLTCIADVVKNDNPVLWAEQFYLDVNESSPVNAQAKADQIFTDALLEPYKSTMRDVISLTD